MLSLEVVRGKGCGLYVAKDNIGKSRHHLVKESENTLVQEEEDQIWFCANVINDKAPKVIIDFALHFFFSYFKVELALAKPLSFLKIQN